MTGSRKCHDWVLDGFWLVLAALVSVFGSVRCVCVANRSECLQPRVQTLPVSVDGRNRCSVGVGCGFAEREFIFTCLTFPAEAATHIVGLRFVGLWQKPAGTGADFPEHGV